MAILNLTNYKILIYQFALLLLVASLPFSPFGISVSLMIMVLSWIIVGQFQNYWSKLINNKSLIFFLSIYTIHLLWLFLTDDLNRGMLDLKIKLPLFIIPLIVGTFYTLEFRFVKLILLTFCLSVFISTILIALIVFDFIPVDYLDIRYASVFISHIRLSLFVDFVILVSFWAIYKQWISGKYIIHLVFVAIFWLFMFLILLKAATGIVLLFIIGTIVFFVFYFKELSKSKKITSVFTFSILFIFLLSYIVLSVNKFYQTNEYEASKNKYLTINGNHYAHDTNSNDKENGYYTGLYLCETEIKQQWNARSKYPYDSLDRLGQPVRSTLIRYMTSKGLKKDSIGLMSLTNQDISNIEKGMTNWIFEKKFDIYPRIYTILWEIEQYKNGHIPIGHSVTQRILFLEIAVEIIKQNFWYGIGTGDIPLEYKKIYNRKYPEVPEKFQKGTHNQFLSFAIAFGIPIAVFIIFAFIYPVLVRPKEYFRFTILLLLLFSFINEDTLETQAGVTFFTFFYSLFVFNLKK